MYSKIGEGFWLDNGDFGGMILDVYFRVAPNGRQMIAWFDRAEGDPNAAALEAVHEEDVTDAGDDEAVGALVDKFLSALDLYDPSRHVATSAEEFTAAVDASEEADEPAAPPVVQEDTSACVAEVVQLYAKNKAKGKPDIWSPRDRTVANLCAMSIVAHKAPGEMTDADRAAVEGYSGWGGLSIREAADSFPSVEGFPRPDPQGLIHEYYTPTNVSAAMAGAIATLLPSVPRAGGRIVGLEPSAGIGRLIQAASGEAFGEVDWTVVEFSALSARMLAAIRPDVKVTHSSFERWVAENEHAYHGKVGLVMANPPYGKRGAMLVEDRDMDYREDRAYVYFLRRCADLLAPRGVAAFLIPAGFLTGTGAKMRKLRETVLKRHHLSAAFRLPSDLFPGAMLVTDMVFLRARAGSLALVAPGDEFIAEGRYFEQNPAHILGVEVGKTSDEDDQTKTPRFGYQVKGTFTGLPAFVERPLTDDLMGEAQSKRFAGTAERTGQGLKRRREKVITGEMPEHVVTAVDLGERVDRYLALAAKEESQAHVSMWGELTDALKAWKVQNGNPHANEALSLFIERGNDYLSRFSQAFADDGELVPGLATRPTWNPRYQGGDDLAGIASFVHRRRNRMTLDHLGAELARVHGVSVEAGRARAEAALPSLHALGWRLTGAAWDELEPTRAYLSGELWPKYDALSELLASMATNDAIHGLPRAAIEAQRVEVLRTIEPLSFEEIDAPPEQKPGQPPVKPDWTARDGWVPLDILNAWFAANEFEHEPEYRRPKLARVGGFLTLEGVSYEELRNDENDFYDETMKKKVGWINHDNYLFTFGVSKAEREARVTVDDKRLRYAESWDDNFRSFVRASAQLRERFTDAYNRQFRGYAGFEYGNEPLALARWCDVVGPRDGYPVIALKDHQVRAVHRVCANRGGLLAFDVGVGKSFTGCAIVAKGRQEGWIRRPVIIVPNSIVWKWVRDFAKTLPDFRVVVIGSKRKVLQRGARAGVSVSATDTPEERGAKWARFQSGEYDVAIVTYSSFGRTRINEEMLVKYAERTMAIRKNVELERMEIQRLRDAADASKKGRKEIINVDALSPSELAKLSKKEIAAARSAKRRTEREDAILEQGVQAWVAQKMELPPKQKYDPGLAWDELGIDFVIVDEAQNFKNLYLPKEREFGRIKYMGGRGAGSNRAWQMDFRCAVVRHTAGGAGVCLLSATPAKNSPLEFYNLIQYIDHDIWERMGVTDSEQFITHYIRLNVKERSEFVENDEGEQQLVTTKSMRCTGFKNMHELRSVIFRYGDFKTAEDVKLKIPEAIVRFVGEGGGNFTSIVEKVTDDAGEHQEYHYYDPNGVEVQMYDVGLPMDPWQRAKDNRLRASMKELKKKIANAKAAKSPDLNDLLNKLLGISQRRAMVAIHSEMDEKYDWDNALEVPDRHFIRIVDAPKESHYVSGDYVPGEIAQHILDSNPGLQVGEVIGTILPSKFIGETIVGGPTFAVTVRFEMEPGYTSPKFKALALRVAANLSCGQTVVVDDGRQQDAVEVLVDAGTPRELILVLTADNAAELARFRSGPARAAGDYHVVVTTKALFETMDVASRACTRLGGDPSEDSFREVARQVFLARTCGHIVFIENIAAHRWIQRTLMDAGIPESRIGILNGKVAKEISVRQEVADGFNGEAESQTEPLYDVVICNQIAYEGVDLQSRTCAIHHLDLPWEPATLQQRNGRGVRQGNVLESLEVNYYFTRRSFDGVRFAMIAGKLGWMTDLIRSTKRSTNNPAEGMDDDMTEIMGEDDPEAALALLRQNRKAAAEAARLSLALQASSYLATANGAFTRARSGRGGEFIAAAERAKGEDKLSHALAADPALWPWASVATKVRDHKMIVRTDKILCPLHEEMRARVQNLNGTFWIEFGRVLPPDDVTIGYRIVASDSKPIADGSDWRVATAADVFDQWPILPENVSPDDFPVFTAEDEFKTLRGRVSMQGGAEVWTTVQKLLRIAPDSWAARMWAHMGALVTERLGSRTYKFMRYAPGGHVIDEMRADPGTDLYIMVRNGQLMLGRSWEFGEPGTEAFPPTLDGFRAFLALAARTKAVKPTEATPATPEVPAEGDKPAVPARPAKPATVGLTYTKLDEACGRWFRQKMPTGHLGVELMTAEERAAEEDAARAATGLGMSSRKVAALGIKPSAKDAPTLFAEGAMPEKFRAPEADAE